MKSLLLAAHILNYITLIVLFLLDDLNMQVMQKIFIFIGVSVIILVITLINYSVNRKRKDMNDMTLKDVALLSIILCVFNIIGIPALVILIAFYVN